MVACSAKEVGAAGDCCWKYGLEGAGRDDSESDTVVDESVGGVTRRTYDELNVRDLPLLLLHIFATSSLFSFIYKNCKQEIVNRVRETIRPDTTGNTE